MRPVGRFAIGKTLRLNSRSRIYSVGKCTSVYILLFKKGTISVLYVPTMYYYRTYYHEYYVDILSFPAHAIRHKYA